MFRTYGKRALDLFRNQASKNKSHGHGYYGEFYWSYTCERLRTKWKEVADVKDKKTFKRLAKQKRFVKQCPLDWSRTRPFPLNDWWGRIWNVSNCLKGTSHSWSEAGHSPLLDRISLESGITDSARDHDGWPRIHCKWTSWFGLNRISKSEQWSAWLLGHYMKCSNTLKAQRSFLAKYHHCQPHKYWLECDGSVCTSLAEHKELLMFLRDICFTGSVSISSTSVILLQEEMDAP